METKTTYFEKPGAGNTDTVLALAGQRARELGIKTVVVASTSGSTAAKAVDAFKGLKVIAVTHTAGFREPNTQEFTEANRKIVEGKGGTIITAAHTFGGISIAIRPRVTPPQGAPAGAPPQPMAPPPPLNTLGDLVAATLRSFGQGMKVACEVAVMASDAGAARTDEDIMTIGGTHSGADTAIIVQSSIAQRFFDFKVKEIICKPRL